MSNSSTIAASVVGPEGRQVSPEFNPFARPTREGRGIGNIGGNPSVSNPDRYGRVRQTMQNIEPVDWPSVMDRAAAWAAATEVVELKAYILAAYRALPFEDRVRFINYIGAGGRGQ